MHLPSADHATGGGEHEFAGPVICKGTSSTTMSSKRERQLALRDGEDLMTVISTDSMATATATLWDQGVLAHALAAMANPVFITDSAGRIVWTNDAFVHLTGYTPKELLGQTPSLLSSGKHDSAMYRDLWTTICAGQPWRGHLVDRRKDGSLYTVDETITPLRDADGRITHFVAVQSDITQYSQGNDRAQRLAYRDSLTDLPNRVYFLELLHRQIQSELAHEHTNSALLFVDLDHFKPINDTHGHATGDRFLAIVAERLRGAVRQTDTVARLGGDEFAILVHNVTDHDSLVTFAQRVLGAIAHPVILPNGAVSTTASIGIALCPRDGARPEDLLHRADQAMYTVKRRGGNSFQIFGADLS